MKQLFLLGDTIERSLPTPASSTSVFSPCGDIQAISFFPTSDEASTQIKMRVSGTITNFSVYISSNSRASSTVFGIRKNGANGNNSVTVGAGLTGVFEDTSSSDSISVSDLICYRITRGTGTLAHAMQWASCVFEPSSNLVHYCPSVDYTFSADRFFAIIGGGAFTSETPSRQNLYATTVFSNLRFYARLNTRSTATTIVLRKNGASGSLSVSVTASTTGEFEDTSNTVSFSSGDDVGVFGDIVAGTGSLTGNVQVTSDLPNQLLGVAVSSGLNSNATHYYPPVGSPNISSTAESLVSVPIQFNGTIDHLYARVETNTLDVATTVRTRKNNSNSNMSLSVSAGATGEFEDTSNSETFNDGDGIDYQVSIPAGTGSINFNTISALFTSLNTNIKTLNGLPYASTKVKNGLAKESIKSVNNLQ